MKLPPSVIGLDDKNEPLAAPSLSWSPTPATPTLRKTFQASPQNTLLYFRKRGSLEFGDI